PLREGPPAAALPLVLHPRAVDAQARAGVELHGERSLAEHRVDEHHRDRVVVAIVRRVVRVTGIIRIVRITCIATDHHGHGGDAGAVAVVSHSHPGVVLPGAGIGVVVAAAGPAVVNHAVAVGIELVPDDAAVRVLA